MSRLTDWIHSGPRLTSVLGSFGSAAFLGVALSGLTGCADSSTSPSGASSDDEGETAQAANLTSLPDFLAFSPGSRQRVPFRGVRLVKQFEVDADGIGEALEIREDVGADGSSGYSIELLDIVTLPSTMDRSLYEITHARSVDSLWSKRDFHIEDLDLAAANYTIDHASQTTVVAGIVCEQVEFTRLVPHEHRPGHYSVDFDPTTGFVLAWVEFDNDGDVLASSMYESFSYRPLLDDMVLDGADFEGTGLDLMGSLTDQAGFTVFEPDLLPLGYEFYEAETFSVPQQFTTSGNSLLPTGSWIRMHATDGIESVSFAHAATVTSSPSIGDDQLNVLKQGSWDFGFGRASGISFIVAGRVSITAMRQLVESAVR